MKDKGLDKGLIREFNTSDRNKRGWAKGFFGFRKMFWEYLNKLHVPFYDDCCEEAADITYPVRWNESLKRMEKYNGTAWVDITEIVETTTTTTTTTAYLPDFTPFISMGVGGVGFTEPPSAGSSKDFMVTIQEIGNASSTGQVAFRIIKSANYTITWSNVSGTSNVPGPTANNNSDWDFTQDPTYIYVTLKTGVLISPFGSSNIGFTITRNNGVPINTVTNLSVIIVAGSGGDSNSSNNSKSVNLLAE